MKIYSFEKTFSQRLHEMNIVLEENGDVRRQWTDFIETNCEPAGYQAIWKLSRNSCEDLDIKYPTEVLGTVQNTLFDELKTVFVIECVNDESVHLPEVCQVPIEDLYPTIAQENCVLNADLTADYLDRYRFFCNFIIMPWEQNNDDDSENSFQYKSLIPRMKLFYDLKNKIIPKGLSSYIRNMLAEAKHIQARRENLESSIEEQQSDDDLDISKGEPKETARQLLELHLRINKIKQEMEVLVNPELRVIYEEMLFKHLKSDAERKIFAITSISTIDEQLQSIEKLKQKISDNAKIHWSSSLCDAISSTSATSEIYLPQGQHSLNFLEYLSGNLLLAGINTIGMDSIKEGGFNQYAMVKADKSELVLFAMCGDMRLENLILNCENVKTGIIVRGGKVTIKNCLFIGDGKSSEGISVSGTSEVLIENSIISSFASAISIAGSAKFTLRNTQIKSSKIGINMIEESMIFLEGSSIEDCQEYGILKTSTMKDGEGKAKSVDPEDKTSLEEYQMHLMSDDNKFVSNKNNIHILAQFSEEIVEESDMMDDEDDMEL